MPSATEECIAFLEQSCSCEGARVALAEVLRVAIVWVSRWSLRRPRKRVKGVHSRSHRSRDPFAPFLARVVDVLDF